MVIISVIHDYVHDNAIIEYDERISGLSSALLDTRI